MAAMSDIMQIYQQFETLWHAGKDACLHLECHAGQVWLNLQVHLQPPPPPYHHQYHRPHPRNSPSRQRRRERRQAARRASADAEEAYENPVVLKPAPVIGDAAAKVAVSVPPAQAVHSGVAGQAGHSYLAAQQQFSVEQEEVDHKTLSAVNADQQCVQIPQIDGLICDTDDPHEDDKKTDDDITSEKIANLSVMSVCSTDIPPDPYPCRFCLLVSELPNYPTPKPTDPVCTVCKIPMDDRYNPHSCCGVLMHENCWGRHNCIGQE